MPSLGVVFTRLALGAVVLVSMVASAPVASAHVVRAGDDVHLAQTIGGTELTVVIRRTQTVPGPLQVDLIVHHPVPELAVDLSVRSTRDGELAAGSVRVERDRAGTYPVVLRVRDVGAHELRLRTSDELSVLPFEVSVPSAAPEELWAYGGFAAAGLLLATALFAAAGARRTAAKAVGGCGVLALVVAVTAAVLPPRPGTGRPESSRPYAQVLVATAPVAPEAGEPFTLRLDLVDGATGRPVDDLSPHHSALAHLVITSEDGEFFRHLHPLRTAAGRLEVRLRADRPGRHLVHVELERAGSGGQVVSSAFRVAPGTAPPVGRPDRPEVTWALLPPRPVAGRPVTIEVDAGTTGVQPWLGMPGHLIVRSRAGDFLGHVHESGAMTSAVPGPDDTVARFGPTLRFTFTFPRPGHYLLWLQFAEDFQILTVPSAIDVGHEDGAG